MRPEHGDERDRAPAPDDAGEHEPPPPATWAGRHRAEGEHPPAEDEARAEGEHPPAEDESPPAEGDQVSGEAGEDVRSGFTEEYDEIERELDSELADLTDDADDATDDADDATDDDGGEPEAQLEADELSQEDLDEIDDEEELAAAAAGADPDPGATVEADTPALADKTEAEEAALAALRARAGHPEGPPQPRTPRPATGGGDADAQPREPQHDESEAAETPAETPAQQPALAAAGDEGGKTPRARPVWLRFLTASVVIVISMAAATSISLLVYLTDIARGLEDNGLFAKIGDQLDEVEGGDPQTILILGSDKRPTDDTGRSDTTILLRVDPDSDRVALLSIPRDLKVNIPGHGTDKLNAAYSIGGANKTFKVVKNLVGIPIHHVVNINFVGFADAVNAIGCVYIDVDRRYFIPAESDISEIDIEAGYQRLCGYKALQYVRFRHEDTDLVRSARQQDFLREARQKLSPQQIVRDSDYRGELIDIFTDYTTSDINSATQLLDLIKTFLGAADANVNEVHFPAELGGANSAYVDADPKQIEAAVNEFLNGAGTPGPAPTGEREDGDGGGGGGKKPKKDKPKKDKSDDEPNPDAPAMEDSSVVGEQVAVALQDAKKKSGKPMLDFPVMYPTRMLPGSTLQSTEAASRAFVIDGPGDDVYHGYKIVLDYFGQGGFSEYYGISGTNWLDAPILDNPSEVRKIDGREYMLFYDGDRLRLVAWKSGKAAYWVQNTLAQALDEDVMMSIATSARKLGD